MVKKIKTTLIGFSAVIVFALAMVVPAAVSAAATADIPGALCAGANLDVNQPTCPTNEEANSGTGVNTLIADVINIFSVVVGVIAVIMIIIGGLRYITSGGDSANVTGAKNTILYAIVGLVIVALAQVIVRFVLSRTISATTAANGS